MIKKADAISQLRNHRMSLQNVEETLNSIIQKNIKTRKDTDKSPIEIPIVNDEYSGKDSNVILAKNASLAKKMLEDSGYNVRNRYAPNNTCLVVDWIEN